MSRKGGSGFNDLIRLVHEIAAPLNETAAGRRPRRASGGYEDVDPDQLYDLYFQGPQESRTVWKGTTFSAAMGLLNAFSLLISLALPELAEIKFQARFSHRRAGADPAAFEVRYILSSTGRTRRIVTPADNARAESNIIPEVEDFQR